MEVSKLQKKTKKIKVETTIKKVERLPLDSEKLNIFLGILSAVKVRENFGLIDMRSVN